MTPRGCAILHVPHRNQQLICTSLPTSWGYRNPKARADILPSEYFVQLFQKVSTIDNTPYLCVPKALEFREKVCGGEDAIRRYSEKIAEDGGKRVAELLGTEVLPTSRTCCFTNVRLPLRSSEIVTLNDQGVQVAQWMEDTTGREYHTYIPVHFYKGEFWCRLSGQIYLTIEDFEWAAGMLGELCDRVKAGDWTR